MRGLKLHNVAILTPHGTLNLAADLTLTVRTKLCASHVGLLHLFYEATEMRKETLQVMPRESLLVMGRSGCGKSSLLRTISGLWSTGSGIIETPEVLLLHILNPSVLENILPGSTTLLTHMLVQAGELFFLPQKPYMPIGTLRQQLTFPSGVRNRTILTSEHGSHLKVET